MRLELWRKEKQWSLAQLGEALGFEGQNVARAAQRIERGEVKIDADLAERIADLTLNAVRPQDLHETRLAWLKANRPDQLETAGA